MEIQRQNRNAKPKSRESQKTDKKDVGRRGMGRGRIGSGRKEGRKFEEHKNIMQRITKIMKRSTKMRSNRHTKLMGMKRVEVIIVTGCRSHINGV